MGQSAVSANPGANGVALAPVTSHTRRDGAIAQIKRAIIRGALRPGEKLTETQLSVSLEVSRPTVREALSQLAQDGLLIQEPYRRWRVATLTPTGIVAIAEARVAIDVEAVAEILADDTGRRMTQFLQGWARYQQLAFDPDPVVRHEAHLAFHRSIWEASENVLLLKMWPVAEAHLTIALAQDQMTRSDPQRAYDVHAKLVAAIQTRDMTAIRAAFVAHTIDNAQELAAMLTSQSVAD
jgi:DNA-binding GntR family transcriptional regulator